MASTSNNARPGQSTSRIVTSLLAIIPLLASLAVLVWGFFFLRDIQLAKDSNIPQAVTVLMAIVWGVGGVVLLFTTANFFIEQLSDRWIRRLQPVLFVGPAILMLVWALVLPTIRTLILSFYDEASINFVWFENFKYVFTNEGMLVVFRNAFHSFCWFVDRRARRQKQVRIICQSIDLYADGNFIRRRRRDLEFCIFRQTSGCTTDRLA